jgi:hypothetical protein
MIHHVVMRVDSSWQASRFVEKIQLIHAPDNTSNLTSTENLLRLFLSHFPGSSGR